MKKLILIPLAAAFALTACGEPDTVVTDEPDVEEALPQDVMPEQPPIDGTLSDETISNDTSSAIDGAMNGDDAKPDIAAPADDETIAPVAE